MSFLDNILHPQGSAGRAPTDADAIKALAAISAPNAPRRPSALPYAETRNPSAVGHDSSQLLHPPDASVDAAAAAQRVQENREPAHVRPEPTASQMRKPSDGPPPRPDMAHSHIASLKQDHTSRTQSPLRESSVPVPSTETPAPATASASAPRKRPPPKSAAKKGTAATVKKDPSKKRKPDPSSRPRPKPATTKRVGSTSATPAGTSPGPLSVRTASSPPRSSPSAGVADADNASDNEEDEDQGTPDPDAELYCLCRRPDTGTFMIGCDGGCDDWFHGKCVGIAEKDRGLIDKYICPRCEEKEIGVTTWKRMCRRDGCRLPARVKTKDGSSKYCSDECGLLFFKGLLANARPTGHAPSPGSKRARRPAHDARGQGPRGGVISAGELKTLLASAPSIDEFRRLGEGVLSPPATPPGQKHVRSATGLNDIEVERLALITETKDSTRKRHSLLKDRTKFVTILKQSAARLAEDRNLKPEDVCGFDERVTWTDDQFAAWRESPEGAEALRTAVLNVAVASADGAVLEPCTKRKCAKHYEWAKLQLDDTRFELGENGEAMRALEREEKEIKERASLRAREMQAGGSGGEVEVHDHSFGPETPSQRPIDDEILATAGDDAISIEEDEDTPKDERKEDEDGMEGLEEHQIQLKRESEQAQGKGPEQDDMESPTLENKDPQPERVPEQEPQRELEPGHQEPKRESEESEEPKQQPAGPVAQDTEMADAAI